MMPGHGDLDLLRILRAAEATARIPVVLLTARAGTESITEGLALGRRILVKPFVPTELLTTAGPTLRRQPPNRADRAARDGQPGAVNAVLPSRYRCPDGPVGTSTTCARRKTTANAINRAARPQTPIRTSCGESAS